MRSTRKEKNARHTLKAQINLYSFSHNRQKYTVHKRSINKFKLIAIVALRKVVYEFEGVDYRDN